MVEGAEGVVGGLPEPLIARIFERGYPEEQ